MTNRQKITIKKDWVCAGSSRVNIVGATYSQALSFIESLRRSGVKDYCLKPILKGGKTMIKTVKGYKGSVDRITFIISEIIKFFPNIKDGELTVDGGRAWGNGIYISDCLFTVRIYTPLKAYEFNQVSGLTDYFFDGIDNIFNNLLKDAREALNGINNHFTIEQAKSFLKYNKER
jgi:hypothetical protein